MSLAPPAPRSVGSTLPGLLQPRRSTCGFVDGLAGWGDRPAVHTPDGVITYRELAGAVRAARTQLSTTRQLVLLAAENTVDWLTTYLAALSLGHVVLLAPGDRPAHVAGLVERFRPGTVAQRSGSAWTVAPQVGVPEHDLHPDLALLLPTSGSTGSPKLVRLSHDNLDSNAASIVEALHLTERDRAMAALPVHYSYGLSVVHSHLACGGSLVLSDLSVVDPCFWTLFRDSGATGLAGVPHTYDLLERSGFAERDLPGLRTLTQAGGPLPAATADRFRALAAERGWRFSTMYGQTEATARMAVLPPELAATHPDAVGVAVPGGSFRVDAVPAHDEPLAEGVGELVYSGPNVMLGYATGVADLARGRDVHELRTGDLGTVDAAGVVRVVGRRSRFAKVLGLRLDLDHLEGDLGAAGAPVRCLDLGGRLGVVTPRPGHAETLLETLGDRHGLPRTSVVVLDGCELPILASGKPDYVEMRTQLTAVAAEVDTAGADRCELVVRLYRDLLGCPAASARTSFVDLGGDSLSYVEVSVRLEEVLGTLPADWQRRTPTDLAEASTIPVTASDARPRWRRVETNVVIRALAVLLILSNHTKLADLPGGAHTLLVIAGYNLARFQLTGRAPRERAARILHGVLRIWAPSAVWIAVVAVVVGTYDWRNVLLLNQVFGDWARWGPHWHFWFIEALVALMVGAAALCLVPGFHRLERRHAFAVPMALVGLGLLTRYAVVIPDAGPYRGANALVLLWLFATGWAASRATNRWQRLLVSAVPVLTLPGFWPTMPGREVTIIAGVLLLIWAPTLPVPAVTVRAMSAVASASLFVYLTHFAVYPHVMPVSSGLAVLASLAVGLLYWKVWGWASAAVGRRARATAGALRRRSAVGRGIVGEGPHGADHLHRDRRPRRPGL
ncbi:Acyl-CoA synthetase (AMP-forming)/AMP-acid ligase II [Pedococcus dokdonensis]|uniref:Acyl-CoA synthetase (AMP-forming)/AMP-acid ligase II n=1 Tax=Pedococcus dokdonensis TaxID=443156 RepID=A0A1H0SYY6_9MICO|nr:AMP-binding protein [Pedococcus dokdonensis]SDP47072.1 Acyl-CoA synthetase (AMP-forming)/AMP-acid ligase II [Pedococcus dokdonensis]